jgi:hypothetical protein
MPLSRPVLRLLRANPLVPNFTGAPFRSTLSAISGVIPSPIHLHQRKLTTPQSSKHVGKRTSVLSASLTISALLLRGVADALIGAGIYIFPGFEASSSEGVHLLCLFPRTTSFEELERIIGRCGVSNLDATSPLSDQSSEKLMELIATCGGVTIAAHVCSSNGLLTTLKGQSAARTWCSDHLLAVALPGAARDAPDAQRGIYFEPRPELST